MAEWTATTATNRESGVISDRFYRGLRHTSGLTNEEERLILIHINGVFERPPRRRHKA
jgi:hypothetical protein